MSEATLTGPRPRRLRPALLTIGALIATVLMFLFVPFPASSTRSATVQRLMHAAKTDDHAAFAAQVAPGGKLWPLFDVTARLDPSGVRELIGDCRLLRMDEGLDTVSAQFDCARDANGQFFIDFEFDGAKVTEVRFVELGRSVRSPVIRDLENRLADAINGIRYAL